MTNPSMLEQVARAMSVVGYGEETYWLDFHLFARAAIAAMELPTEEMLAAARVNYTFPPGNQDALDASLARDFTQMIRAALKEEK